MRVALVTLLLLVACSKAKEGEGGGGGDPPQSDDDVLAAWKAGGLEPSAFTKATVDVGKDCKSGTVNKVDVLVCTFASDQEAKAAEDPGLKWVGNHTGASRANGKTLIVAADRRKADPSGRTINLLVTLPAK